MFRILVLVCVVVASAKFGTALMNNAEASLINHSNTVAAAIDQIK